MLKGCEYSRVCVCVDRATAWQGENRLSVQLGSSPQQHSSLPHLWSPAQQREEQDQTQQGIFRHRGRGQGSGSFTVNLP